jgi:hypothetical protein
MDPEVKRLIVTLKNDVDTTTSADVSGGFENPNVSGAVVAHESAVSALQHSGNQGIAQGSFEDIPLLSSSVSEN